MLVIVITVSCLIITAITAIAAWWYTKSDHQAASSNARVLTAIQPVVDRVQALEIIHDHDHREDERARIRATVAEAMQPVVTELTEIKVNLGIAMAKILHQPDPRRAHIDRLLEAFMEGTLTVDERTELKKHLNVISKWEPGQDSPYPIHAGEPVAAAILLLTMDDPHNRAK